MPELVSIEKHKRRDRVERIRCDEVSKEEFVERFEKESIPAVIEGGVEDWVACQEWTLEVSANEKVVMQTSETAQPNDYVWT